MGIRISRSEQTAQPPVTLPQSRPDKWRPGRTRVSLLMRLNCALYSMFRARSPSRFSTTSFLMLFPAAFAPPPSLKPRFAVLSPLGLPLMFRNHPFALFTTSFRLPSVVPSILSCLPTLVFPARLFSSQSLKCLHGPVSQISLSCRGCSWPCRVSSSTASTAPRIRSSTFLSSPVRSGRPTAPSSSKTPVNTRRIRSGSSSAERYLRSTRSPPF